MLTIRGQNNREGHPGKGRAGDAESAGRPISKPPEQPPERALERAAAGRCKVNG